MSSVYSIDIVLLQKSIFFVQQSAKMQNYSKQLHHIYELRLCLCSSLKRNDFLLKETNPNTRDIAEISN